MQAVVVNAPSTVELAEVPAPEPRVGEVVLDVSLIGICGTDLHIVDGHYASARYPVIPGHEAVGHVSAVGPDVTDLEIGAKVVIDPGLPCRICRQCRRGRPNICEDRNAIGVTRPGGASSQLVVPAANCHRIDGAVAASVAVLAEPLACVLHAFDLVADTAGADVAVYGAGAIGALAAQVARRLGADSVTVIEPHEDRAAGARARGADAVVPDAGSAGPDSQWDLVVDASGSAAAVADALSRIARGGTYLQIGVVPAGAEVPLSPYDIYAREIQIRGSMTTRFTFPRALRLLASGAIDTTEMVGRPYTLSEYEQAIAAARAGESLKVVVDPRR